MDVNKLSDRELEVLFWIANGKEPGEVAQILEISQKRVNNVLYELRKRLRCHTTAHLVALAMARGYISHKQIYDELRQTNNRAWYKAVARFMMVVLCVVPIFDVDLPDDQRIFRTRTRRREEVEVTL